MNNNRVHIEAIKAEVDELFSERISEVEKKDTDKLLSKIEQFDGKVYLYRKIDTRRNEALQKLAENYLKYFIEQHPDNSPALFIELQTKRANQLQSYFPDKTKNTQKEYYYSLQRWINFLENEFDNEKRLEFYKERLKNEFKQFQMYNDKVKTKNELELELYAQTLPLIEKANQLYSENKNENKSVEQKIKLKTEAEEVSNLLSQLENKIRKLNPDRCTFNPVHDFELLKHYRRNQFEDKKQKFIEGREIKHLVTNEFELNYFYFDWLQNELKVIEQWLSDKFPNGKEKTIKGNISTKIELQKYKNFINYEIAKTEQHIIMKQQEPEPFSQLFEKALLFETIEQPKNEQHKVALESYYNLIFNNWLQENKGLKFGNRNQYTELMTKENWKEFLTFENQNKKNAIEKFEIEKQSWQPQQIETKTEQETIEMKPVLKAEAVQIVFDVLKDFFSPEQQPELKQVIETGKNASKKLLFKGNGIRLTDTFKKLIERNFFAGCQKKDLENWIFQNFKFVKEGKSTDFKMDVLKKYISENASICKSPLIKIENGKIEKVDKPRTKDYNKW